jgi:hypothetical protein
MKNNKTVLFNQKYVVRIFKFILLFVITFLIAILTKRPLEHALVNSEIVQGNVPTVIIATIIAIPSIVFYFLIGIIITKITNNNYWVWVLIYCIADYLMFYLNTVRYSFFAGVDGFLLLYFRKIIMPFAMGVGVWLGRKTERNNGVRSLNISSTGL